MLDQHAAVGAKLGKNDLFASTAFEISYIQTFSDVMALHHHISNFRKCFLCSKLLLYKTWNFIYDDGVSKSGPVLLGWFYEIQSRAGKSRYRASKVELGATK